MRHLVLSFINIALCHNNFSIAIVCGSKSDLGQFLSRDTHQAFYVSIAATWHGVAFVFFQASRVCGSRSGLRLILVSRRLPVGLSRVIAGVSYTGYHLTVVVVSPSCLVVRCAWAALASAVESTVTRSSHPQVSYVV